MKHKWLVLVAMALVAIPIITIASPASACVNGWTPGFWKNHLSAWRYYSPEDTIFETFGVEPDQLPSAFDEESTLLDALNKGGGGIYAFMRQAAAQLLNTTRPTGQITGHTTWFIGLVHDVLVSFDDNPLAKIFHSDSSFVNHNWTVEQWKNYIESYHIY